VSVVGDSETVPRGLYAVSSQRGLAVDFLVECDTGNERTGVQVGVTGGHVFCQARDVAL
jgi:D-serine deaminase-like pyridoxal phosphate-dependent protein